MSKPTTVLFPYPTRKEEMPTGPWAEAGVLVDVNAGWRIVRPLFDGEKCNQCQLCWLICPGGAVDRARESYTVDLNFCKGCGLCAYECPKEAITMVKEGREIE